MKKNAGSATAKAKTAAKVQGAAAFGKFVSVLQSIADAATPPTLADLCTASGLPRTTMYRILAGLASEGLVKEDNQRKSFSLGPRLIALASKSWESSDLRTLAYGELDELRNRIGETVHLAVPSGLTMVYIDKLESPQTVRMASRIGTQVPLYSSSVGKSYLATLSEAERAALLDRIEFARITAHTLTSRKQVELEIQRTERRGYAVDREENELEIRCVGAAIRDRSGSAVGAISISTPKYRFVGDAEEKYARMAVEYANRISAKVKLAGGGPKSI